MLQVCDSDHEEIVYDGRKCPICILLKEKDSDIESLEDEVDDLKSKIEDLTNKISEMESRYVM